MYIYTKKSEDIKLHFKNIRKGFRKVYINNDDNIINNDTNFINRGN